jgi:cell division protease FtsH
MNPRDKRPGDRRSLTTGGRPGGAIWYILAFLMLMALASAWLSAPGGRAITYSEFKQAVRSGQVAEVTVGEQTVRGAYKRETNGSINFNTTRIEDPKLIEELDAADVKYTGEFINPWFSEILSGLFLLLLLFAVWSFFFRRMSGAEGGVMSFARSKHRVFAEDDVKVSFADVAGVDEAEQELKEIVEFLQNPRKYTTLGGRIPKGVLLVGPPGTGKTLLARAVAGEAKVPFFSLSGSEFVEMFVGVGAARVRDLFAQAEQKAPCIIFIDELDALGRARVQSPMGSHEEREQTLNQLLAEMDGFDSRKAIIIMAATNRPEVLDPALLRPGRFDRQVLVDKPDVRGREEVLQIHTKQVKLSPAVDLKKVAARTAGFAGADLANLVNEAALLAARKDKTSVEMVDFDEAIDRLIAGLEKKRVMSDKEREIVAYHEAGHAIVATSIPGMDPVHKISIVQRGFGALGYTMQLPLEDRYLMQRRDLLSQLAVLLGGRTAEEIALGEISTGAQNDLQRATDIARAMVTEWGMSDALGAVNYDGNKRSKFLDIPIGPERGAYAEDTARLIDTEVKRIMTDAHGAATRILTERRDQLEAVTRRLLDQEVMEGDQLRHILGVPEAPAPDGSPDHTPLPPVNGIH